MTELESGIIQIYSSCSGIIINPDATAAITTNITMQAPPNTYLHITHPNKNTCISNLQVNSQMVTNQEPIVVIMRNSSMDILIISKGICVAKVTQQKITLPAHNIADNNKSPHTPQIAPHFATTDNHL